MELKHEGSTRASRVVAKWSKRVALAIFVALAVEFPISLLVGASVWLEEEDRTTSRAVRWEVDGVWGLWVFTHYDNTFGNPLHGSSSPGFGFAPSSLIVMARLKGFPDVTPYVSYGEKSGEWHNGVTGFVFPQWIPFLLSSVFPLILFGRSLARRWDRRTAAKGPTLTRTLSQHRLIVATAISTFFIVVAGALAWVTFSGPSPDEAKDIGDNRYDMACFASNLKELAEKNGGRCPGPTLSDAIAAVRASGYPSTCPLVMANRDTWGQPFEYEWTNGGRTVAIISWGPNGIGHKHSRRIIRVKLNTTTGEIEGAWN